MSQNTELTQELLELVERCLNKTANTEELKDFEAKLKTDLAFKAQVADIKTLLFGIEEQSLKESLNVFHEELDHETSNKSVPVKTMYIKKIAVAAILVIALGSFWFFSGNTNEKLFAKYFLPDPGLPTMMSKTSNFEFYDAMVNYKLGDYSIAIKKWNELQERKPNNDTLNYFLGVAYLAYKDENAAITYLSSVTTLSQSTFKNEAYYYLGLAYLKAGNVELSKKNLNFSTIDNSKSLLSELND